MFFRHSRTEPQDNDAMALMRHLMPDLYFINTPVSRINRHAALLARLPQEELIFDFHRHEGSRLTELTILAYDDAEPGLLAKVCGTLAAARINISTAYIFTVRDIQTEAMPTPSFEGRWVAFDTLLISEPYFKRERALTSGTIRRLRDSLTEVLHGSTTVAALLARRRPIPLLKIYEVSVTNSDLSGTVITLRTQDGYGLLYRIASAMAALGLHIRVAQVNTSDGATEDIIMVMDRHGHPIAGRQFETLAARLRQALEGSPIVPD